MFAENPQNPERTPINHNPKNQQNFTAEVSV